MPADLTLEIEGVADGLHCILNGSGHGLDGFLDGATVAFTAVPVD